MELPSFAWGTTMKFFRKLYCRTVQLAVRCALLFIPYRPPVLLSSADELADAVKAHGAKNPLVVTGKTVEKFGLLLPVSSALARAGLPYTVFDETTPDPTMSQVEAAFSRYQAASCDAVIAVGGGSPMDCAKGVAAKVLRPHKPLSALGGVGKIRGKAPLLIAVPTTAGSGSEATAAAVVTDEKTRRKFALISPSLVPRYALLDPAFTATLPPAATAETGMDALTHAVEAYIGRATTKETRALCEDAVTRIFDNLIAAVHNGADLAARKNMQLASYEAGVAFTNSFVGYVHAAAHALGGFYHLPHGRLCASLLPLVLRMYGSSCRKKLARLARASKICEDVSDMVAAEAFISKIELLNRALGIPETVPLSKADIPELARRTDREANPLYPVPRLLDESELGEIFQNIGETPLSRP